MTLFTAPAAEPVSASEAKSHLRIDISDDDTLIGTYITAARVRVEQELNRALVTQTWELVLDGFPAGDRIRLPLPPLQSVTSVKYTDEDGVEATYSSANYLVDTDAEPGQIVLKSGVTWPAVTLLREVAAVRIKFVAGYGLAAAVPEPIKLAIKLLVGTYYENREDTLVAQGVTVMRLPTGVRDLLSSYRVRRV